MLNKLIFMSMRFSYLLAVLFLIVSFPANVYAGAGGGGGAGGAAGLSGSAGGNGLNDVNGIGGGGGGGGGGSGGGGGGSHGAGGGVLLKNTGGSMTISGSIDTRGGNTSTVNGGTVKLFYTGTAPSTAGITSGRTYTELVVNIAPGAPTLSLPAASAISVSTLPQFQFASTDTHNDYIRYEVVLYQSDCSTVVRTIDQTTSQTGWSGQNAQTSTAYTSGTTATHTYQAPVLANGTTYCWKARGIDPGGSNTWGAYSGTRSFTTQAIPGTPTLQEPLNGAVGVNATHTFRLTATDADSDYLRYWIDICSTSNCSSIVRSICQANTGTGVPGTCASPGQSGWSSQNQQTATAYSPGQSAAHTYLAPGLSANTQYWWRAYVIDPGGSNTWSGASGINGFTTRDSANDILIQGPACFGVC